MSKITTAPIAEYTAAGPFAAVNIRTGQTTVDNSLIYFVSKSCSVVVIQSVIALVITGKNERTSAYMTTPCENMLSYNRFFVNK